MLTEDQLQFLNRVCRGKWTETDNGIVVEGNVDIYPMNLTRIPVQFSKTRNFECRENKLTTLEGCPLITENFTCRHNKLVNLHYGPKEVNGSYTCRRNNLTSLEGAPSILHGSFDCDYNNLTNLIGAPPETQAFFSCDSNLLTSLEGCPKSIEGDLWCNNNQDLHVLYGIGKTMYYIHYDNNKSEFEELNKWIIEQTHTNIFVTRTDIAKWIKDNNKLYLLLYMPNEFRQYFSPRILRLVDSGVYNESRILDYKKFSRLC